MSVQGKKNAQLTAKITEVSALLEEMIVELELRGCEKNHELVKRALAMKKQFKELL
jgi:hypothetical protein